jgi:hypothetical protein
MFMLRIWVFNSGVLKNVFILSKHGTKANIRSTKMANNRHAYNRGVLPGLVANGIRLTKRGNALSSRSDVTCGLPDLGKSFTLLVCVCFLTSRLTTV